MIGRAIPAKGFPWLKHCTAAEAASRCCKRCGSELNEKNRSGYCRAHRQEAQNGPPPQFGELVAKHYAKDIAEILGVTATTVYRWAQRKGFALKVAHRGGASHLNTTPAPPQVVTLPVTAKQWCQQCERRVSAAEASACRSQFCKAQAVAA
jgi:hypothetical protein